MGEWIQVSDAALYGEHLALGAVFADDEPALALPLRYGVESDAKGLLEEGAALADLDGMSAVLVRGAQSPLFVSAACAGLELAVGECRFAGMLSGDGALLACPLVARTGDAEYLLWDGTDRGVGIYAWLGFLAAIEQDGRRAFDSVEVEDVSDSLHPLFLWGAGARQVLSDYLVEGSSCPSPGEVRDLELDRIPAIVVGVPLGQDAYLLLVPPRNIRPLWRSLLSFMQVAPLGSASLGPLAFESLPWLSDVAGQERIEWTMDELERQGLAYARDGFIGARALR
jgi:aminomethyltransferase